MKLNKLNIEVERRDTMSPSKASGYEANWNKSSRLDSLLEFDFT